MSRVTHCKTCKQVIDEGTRYESIQVYGFAVCSVSCGLKAMEDEDVNE